VFSPRRLLVAVPCLTAALAAVLTAAPAASADLVSLSACNSNTLSRYFSPWADPAYYELAPGGSFSDSSWTLAGGATLVSGGEPFAVLGSVSPNSLSLPSGASATSPSTCVDAAYPDIRFFVAGSGTVGVNVIYNGTVIPSGVVPAGGSWMPGPITVTGSAITGAENGGTAQIQIQLVGLSGNPEVSDVFIDPFHGG